MIRSEMRDSYDPTVKGFAVWQATGDTRAQEWGDHLDVVRAAAARGVRIGRVRVVSEPLSEYLRWSTPAPTSTSAPARTSAGCAAPKPRPAAVRRRLLGVRPAGRAVELPTRRWHEPASLHLQLRSPRHPRHRSGVRDGMDLGDTARALHGRLKLKKRYVARLACVVPRWRRAMPGPSRVWRARVGAAWEPRGIPPLKRDHSGRTGHGACPGTGSLLTPRTAPSALLTCAVLPSAGRGSRNRNSDPSP